MRNELKYFVFLVSVLILILFFAETYNYTGFTVRTSGNTCPSWKEPKDESNFSFVEGVESNVFLNATDTDTNVTFSLYDDDGPNVNKTADKSCFGTISSEEAEESDFSVDTTSHSKGQGNFSFNLSRDFLGNYTATLSVSDEEWGGDCARFVDIHLSFNCTYHKPKLDKISNQTVLLNSSFYYNATAFGDAENFTFTDNSSLFDINSSTGEINFTPNKTGEFLVDISVNDYNDSYNSDNYSDSQTVKFTLAKKPVINWTEVSNLTGPLEAYENGSVVNVTNSTVLLNENMSLSMGENSTLLFNHSSFDSPDNPDNGTNVTYSWLINGKEESADKGWKYHTDFQDSGEYNLSLVVENGYGFSVNQTWGLTVVNVFRKPIFLPNLKPKMEIFYNTTSGNSTTVESIVLQPDVNEGKDTYIVDSDNDTYNNEKNLLVDSSHKSLIEFDLDSVSFDGNLTKSVLNLYLLNISENSSEDVSVHKVTEDWTENETNWYYRKVNETWNTSGGDYNSTPESTISVSDVNNWYQWNITSLSKELLNGSVNNSGILIKTSGSVKKYFASSDYKPKIPDLTWDEDSKLYSTGITKMYNSLDQYFKELDDGNLNYSVVNESVNIDISINDDGSVTFDPKKDWFGTETIAFRASNPGGLTVDSNPVKLTVEEVEEDTNPAPSGGASTIPETEMEEETETASLDIILESTETMDTNDEVKVPLILRNSGEKGLSDINLSLNTSFSSGDNISAELTLDHFGSLATEENTTTYMDIVTENAKEKSYNITVIAEVEDPELTQTAMLRTEVEETDKKVKSDVSDKIQFVQDLFEENPECQDLNVVLEEVGEKIDNNQYKEAKSILDSAVNDCKALITRKEAQEGFNLRGVQEALTYVVVLLVFILMLIFVLYKILYHKTKGR